MAVLLFMPGSDVPKADNWMEKIFFDKWVHSGLFGLLALLWLWPIAKADITPPKKQRLFFTVVLVLISWGLTTEFIQKYLCVSRGFDLWDWAADCFGIIVAYLITLFKFNTGKPANT